MKDGSATKGKIDATALKLFARQGIRETTIRDIAGAAKIAEGTMYRHYKSKDELAWELFHHHFTEIGRAMQEAQAGQTRTRDKVEAMVRHFCEAYDRDADAFTYLFLTRHGHMLRLNLRDPNAYLVFRRVIRAGIRNGEIPAQNVDVAVAMVMGVILQVIDTRLLGGRIKQNISALTDPIVAACLRVLEA